MESMNSFMSMFNIFIGVLCGYSAITGKGFAFKNDYPKEIKPEVDKMMRILTAVLCPLTLFMGIEEYIGIFPQNVSFVVQMVLTALVFALVVAFIIWLRVKFGKIIDKYNNSRSLRR